MAGCVPFLVPPVTKRAGAMFTACMQNIALLSLARNLASKRLLSFVLLLAACAPSLGAELPGRVVGITDGDTLTLLVDERRQVKIRLMGIDAPESRQPFGQVAKRVLSDLAFQKSAMVQFEKQDRYGRVIGKVLVDGVDLNLEMVKAGLAWWYRKYAAEQSGPDQTAYGAAEGEARLAKRGLWVDPDPIPPWDWRKR